MLQNQQQNRQQKKQDEQPAGGLRDYIEALRWIRSQPLERARARINEEAAIITAYLRENDDPLIKKKWDELVARCRDADAVPEPRKRRAKESGSAA